MDGMAISWYAIQILLAKSYGVSLDEFIERTKSLPIPTDVWMMRDVLEVTFGKEGN